MRKLILMHNQHQRIPDLITRFENGHATQAEISELEQWFESFEGGEKYTRTLNDSQRIALKTSLFQTINKEIDTEIFQEKRMRQYKKLNWFAVAAVLILICSGIYLYHTSAIPDFSGHDHYPQLDAKHDIKPGKNIATLTLANGKVLHLSDSKTGITINASKLSYNDGSKVPPFSGDSSLPSAKKPLIETKDMLIASTPKGGTYQVILSDGSHIWLNAASSLKFPSKFSKIREVELTGEAYFEIAKDKSRPFVVKSAGQQVEVLGTHFNINSYTEEGATKTTLLEGSVKIRSDHFDKGRNTVENAVLKPGEQSVLTNNKQLKVQHADLENAIDWKNGDFVFDNEDFKTVMRKISRWYAVNIIYAPSAPTNIELGGWISRSSNISAVLKQIEATGNVYFKIEGKNVTVMSDSYEQ